MAFIDTVPEDRAEDATAEMYGRARDGFGYLPNMVRVFSHRPEVMVAWDALLGSIRENMDFRRYELVTIAAAKELRSSYCMLAHGAVLLRDHFDAADLKAIIDEPDRSALDEADRAIMAFAAKVVRDAPSVTESDIAALHGAGLTDAEIFDIAAAASVRCFFSKTLDALGVHPDAAYRGIEPKLRESLEVGRSIED